MVTGRKLNAVGVWRGSRNSDTALFHPVVPADIDRTSRLALDFHPNETRSYETEIEGNCRMTGFDSDRLRIANAER